MTTSISSEAYGYNSKQKDQAYEKKKVSILQTFRRIQWIVEQMLSCFMNKSLPVCL